MVEHSAGADGCTVGDPMKISAGAQEEAFAHSEAVEEIVRGDGVGHPPFHEASTPSGPVRPRGGVLTPRGCDPELIVRGVWTPARTDIPGIAKQLTDTLNSIRISIGGSPVGAEGGDRRESSRWPVRPCSSTSNLRRPYFMPRPVRKQRGLFFAAATCMCHDPCMCLQQQQEMQCSSNQPAERRSTLNRSSPTQGRFSIGSSSPKKVAKLINVVVPLVYKASALRWATTLVKWLAIFAALRMLLRAGRRLQGLLAGLLRRLAPCMLSRRKRPALAWAGMGEASIRWR